MPLFRRRKKDPEPEPPAREVPPPWASFMSEEGYYEFLGLVDLTLEGMDLDYRLGDGFVEVQLQGSPHTFGLGNLAQNVFDLETEDERRLHIAEHFAHMVRLSEADKDDLPFEAAAPMLRLRLWGAADLPDELDAKLVPVADDLVAMLSLDLPDHVSNVTSTTIAAWGKDEDELLEIARRNTIADPAVELETTEHEDGSVATFCLSDEFFAASRAMWPDTVLDHIGEHGALVAFPNRHVAWLLPIGDAQVVGVINQVAPWVHQRYVEGPGSISPHLYWWRDGTWTRQAVEVTDEAITFVPTADFVELLNDLAR